MSEAAPLIRVATDADLDAVRALLRETWHQVYDPILGAEKVGEVTARWHARELLARELAGPRSSFLVAHEGERLVAHGYAYPRKPATLVVSRLYVRPGAQRRGIGQHMLAALLARHQDAATLRLFVAAQNEAGLAFWHAKGFSVVSEGVEEGARVLHMEKHL